VSHQEGQQQRQSRAGGWYCVPDVEQVVQKQIGVNWMPCITCKRSRSSLKRLKAICCFYPEFRGCVGFHDTADIADKTHNRVANFSRAHDKRLGGLWCVGVLTLSGFLVRSTFFALNVKVGQRGVVCIEQNRRIGHGRTGLLTAFPMAKVY